MPSATYLPDLVAAVRDLLDAEDPRTAHDRVAAQVVELVLTSERTRITAGVTTAQEARSDVTPSEVGATARALAIVNDDPPLAG